MHSKRALVFCVLGVLLASCASDTLTTVRVDVLSFMSQAERAGTLAFAETELLLPSAEGVSSDVMGLPSGMWSSLARFEAHVGGVFTLQGATGNESITLSLHIAEGAESPFAAAPVAETMVTLQPGEATPVRFDVMIGGSENARALETIRGGRFRVGVRVARSGVAGSIEYEVGQLGFSVSLRAGDYLNF